VDVGERVEIGGDEFHVRGHTDGAEDAPADRAEERLGELRVRERRDLLRELGVDAPPERPLERLRAERVAQLGDGAIDPAVVELDALDRIVLAAARVAGVEAQRRTPRISRNSAL
jgi:hypothetical protein